MRLNYGPFTVFIYIVNLILAAFVFLIIYFHPFGTPIDWLGISFSVVIILIMIEPPIVNSMNAPRVRLSVNSYDNPGAKERRFTFQVTNYGRKPATRARLEVRTQLRRWMKPLNHVRFIVFDNEVIPFALQESERWFAPSLGFDLLYNTEDNQIRFRWDRPKEDDKSEDVLFETVTKGPYPTQTTDLELALTWNFADVVEFQREWYTIDRPNGTGAQNLPEIHKTRHF